VKKRSDAQARYRGKFCCGGGGRCCGTGHTMRVSNAVAVVAEPFGVTDEGRSGWPPASHKQSPGTPGVTSLDSSRPTTEVGNPLPHRRIPRRGREAAHR